MNKANKYSGEVTVFFHLLNTDCVFLEFSGNSFTIQHLNNEKVPMGPDNNHCHLRDNNGAFFLPKEYLKTGLEAESINTITITFESHFYKDRQGPVFFEDIDGKVYVYTASEPHYFCRIAPSFDQPDLKATAKIEVDCHKDWKVISNTKREINEDNKAKNGLNDCVKWAFDKTCKFPTYLFTIIAGPFVEIVCPSADLYKEIPMSIFCRES